MLSRGYYSKGVCGDHIIHDNEEKNAQKVKDRHNNERERRREQSKNWSPYQPFVALNELKTATHLNGQRAKAMDQKNKKGRHRVKLEDGTLL